MYSAIAKNKRNTVFIIALFLIIIGALGALSAYIANNWTIAIVTIVIAAVYALIQYFAATAETLALTGAREIRKVDNPRLYRIVENLAITEGLPMPKVYIINDPAPNAFATGRDPQHAVVAATTGILEIMDDAELEGVMAHELGHVKNYDIRVSLVVFGLVIAVGLIADIVLRISIFGGGRGRSNSNNGGPAALVLLVIGLAAAILAPIIAAVVQAAVSRQREYLADATGAMTTRHPEALARALEKLKVYGRPVARNNSSMSHLWIADPSKPGFMQRLFATHPPLDDRIARLRNNATRF
ncbi:M48 family metallopeptidase [Protaetiibacter larvae]|uniref:Protease HtpX homolog n=1 Tax=Protaetiibacter larvae TaxID=2592654 RepID=A0A5C1Y6N5_9MICO|nr:M48 family metallopeptidase [Protaetiibacter larvae]QEO09564.1 M48 family metallopeptidase [Protaetiibacter larvae]